MIHTSFQVESASLVSIAVILIRNGRIALFCFVNFAILFPPIVCVSLSIELFDEPGRIWICAEDVDNPAGGYTKCSAQTAREILPIILTSAISAARSSLFRPSAPHPLPNV